MTTTATIPKPRPPEPFVTVYTVADCIQCEQTQKRLTALAVPYRTVDLETDTSARERFKTEGLKGAPVVQTRTGDTWTGFRFDKIKTVAAQYRSQSAAALAQRCCPATTTVRQAAEPAVARRTPATTPSVVTETAMTR